MRSPWALLRRGRNMNRLSIVYAYRPRLRGCLTLRGMTFRRKPYAYGGQDSHLPYRYSSQHNHSCPVQWSLRSTFNLGTTLPYPAGGSVDPPAATASVACLSPFHFRHHHARPVSCYALFKWWLLLSQHPGCLGTMTSFTTEHALGTLAGGLGSFPFDDEDYPPPSEPRSSRHGIRSLIGFGNPVRPLAHSVLYPHVVVLRAYTYIYFGENQISLSLISLLLQATRHPKPFQRSRVRSSTSCYARFNLRMARSLSFGSTAYNSSRSSHSVSLRLQP